MLFALLAGRKRDWEKRVANQETRSFVKTDHWIGRVIGQGINGEQVLHARQEGRIERAKAPGLLQMRFQVVFFNRFPTKVCEIVAQKPASTTFSASRRRVQRS